MDKAAMAENAMRRWGNMGGAMGNGNDEVISRLDERSENDR